MDPYIQYNEESIAYGGAEFELIDTYAKAYGFTPKLRREPTYDSSTWDARGEGETFIRGPVAKGGFYCLNILPYHWLTGHTGNSWHNYDSILRLVTVSPNIELAQAAKSRERKQGCPTSTNLLTKIDDFSSILSPLQDTNHWDAPDESIFRGMVGSVGFYYFYIPT